MEISKPEDVVGRDTEWSALADFSQASDPPGGVGLIYGRRRTGKSFLLRRLVKAVGGLYFQATESERPDALTEFGEAVAAMDAERTGRRAEPIRYANWADALGRRSGVVVIDELPYLLRHSPELPSLLQRLADEANNGDRDQLRVILCGSSLSVMSELLSGQQPLRGRATLDLLLRPMEHRAAANLWGMDELDLALRLNAIFGGAPGYRALTTGNPRSVNDLGRWLGTNVLNPNHALYREDDYLVQEERTITDRALYGAILRAIASGVSTQTELAARLGRSRESLSHPMSTLLRAGFVLKHQDVLSQRRPEYRLADPIIRFLRLVVDPGRVMLDEGDWSGVWKRAVHRMDANIYGPHLEQVTHQWAKSDVSPSTGYVTRVGHTRVSDPSTRKAIEVDLAVVGEGEPGREEIHLLGEVKWSRQGFDGAPVERLARARDLLGQTGYDVSRCELVLVSRTRPTNSGQGLRVGLPDLYGR